MAGDPSSLDPTLPAKSGPGAAPAPLDATIPSTPPASPAPSDEQRLVVVPRERYHVKTEIAHGGMGRVLEARDVRLGRPVAIKELLGGGDPALRARFEREVRITARLQHPAIVAVHEAGTWPSGEPFFAMKKVSGRPLDAAIAAARTLPERLALLPRLLDVANALAYAHGQGVIHRDLKPSNVLVGEYGETVVIDWGLAKETGAGEGGRVRGDATPLTSGASLDATVAGDVLGTPMYMAPEQARGETVDARADVYALGAMLYQLLAGAPPYEARTVGELIALVKTGPPPPLGSRQRDLPPDLLAIVAKAMEREKDDRYPSAKELAGDLQRFQTGQLVAVHHYTAGQLLRRFLRRHLAAVAVAEREPSC